MKLITQEIRKAMPRLYTNAKLRDADGATIVCKFFTPDANLTWFMAEADAVLADGTQVALSDPLAENATDILFFGYVAGTPFPEWGYTTLSQLLEVRGRLGLPVERDMYFAPKPLFECILP